MEATLSKMSKNIASFCNNLETSTTALKQSLDRRPIPLDSASTTFIQSLNRRVGSLTGDLNRVESMTLGTVSFEELLGHCHQLFKENQSQLCSLHDKLQSLGLVPSDDGVEEFEEDFMSRSLPTSEPDSQFLSSQYGSVLKGFEDDSLFDEPLSLQSLGLSDACLATLGSAAGDSKIDVLDSQPKLHKMEVQHKDSKNICAEELEDGSKLPEALKSVLVVEDDYESLPSYMKTLAPWEDLQSAVEKMNLFLQKKGNSKECNFFYPEELESMGLGSKGRSFVLLLVRMKRLSVETNNGLISYRVL